MKEKPEVVKEVEIKAYSKSELARLYKISPAILHKWLIHWRKQLHELKYDDRQKILTLAQVRFLFRDDVLGKP